MSICVILCDYVFFKVSADLLKLNIASLKKPSESMLPRFSVHMADFLHSLERPMLLAQFERRALLGSPYFDSFSLGHEMLSKVVVHRP